MPKRSIRNGRSRASTRRPQPTSLSEALEPRLMFTTILINGTAGNDTINLFTGRDFGVIGAPFTVNWTVNGGPSQFAIPHSGDSVDINPTFAH